MTTPRILKFGLLATLALAIGCSDEEPEPSQRAEDMGEVAQDMASAPDQRDGVDMSPDMSAGTRDQDMTSAEDMRGEDMADMAEGPAAPASIALALTRDEQGTILAEVTALDAQGETVASEVAPALMAATGELGALVEEAPGRWRAAWTPPNGQPSGAFSVEASLGELTTSRQGLFLPEVHTDWGVPEPVPGLVNTGGWEDSVEISPDGQWLIVGTYSPVHLTECISSGQQAQPPAPYGLPDAPACNEARGPYAAPERPDMPGADRILAADDILQACPRLGVQGSAPGEDAVLALPPVASYGFARQPDGSFAEPFPIYFEMDGCTVAPFGFSFVDLSAQGVASLIFAFDDYRDNSSPENTENDLHYIADAALGQPVLLGEYSVVPGQGLTAPLYRPAILELMERAGGQGNPFRSAEGIWYDDEGSEDIDLYFIPTVGELPDAQFGPAIRVGVSAQGEDDFQPFLHKDRLYYARDFNRIRSHAWMDRSGVAEAAFDAGRVELAVPQTPQTHEGAILSIGEPSLAVDEDGARWLYFVYGARTASGSFDMSVGRVRQR